MDELRWKQVQDLFHQAVDLPDSERQAFLQDTCGEDRKLMVEVLALLDGDGRIGSLLDHELDHVADQLFAEPSPPSIPLQQLGPYRILRRLGEGGMGVVYLAEREDLGSLVAIKFLRDAWLSPLRRERFTIEQRTLAQLTHPFIARLYDANVLSDGTPWFVMEYVEGLPLTDFCNQHQLTIRERLERFRLVCEAVRYAHQNAVIHRDLKPSNILVKEDGSVRLLDFGIAKQLESFETPTDQTQTILRLMTPAYAAPEQIRGEPAGMHSDVYSLGVILYELLAGRLPFNFSSRTPGEFESVVTQQEPEKPSAAVRRMRSGSAAGVPPLSVNNATWAELDVLCLTAMHKDPQRRYRSVEALIRDIDHLLRGEPLEARPDSTAYRLSKFVGRNRRAVTAAALLLALVIGMIGFFTWRLANARNEALAEAARTQRIQQFMLNLFQGGDDSVGPASDLRVVTLVERGVREARALTNDPDVQAELYHTLGGLQQKLGKFEEAEALLESALEQRRSLYGDAHRTVAESLVGLGLLRMEQAQLEEAERLVRQGLEMSRRHLASDHPLVAQATAALGKVLQERGAYDEAVQSYQEAVRLYSSSGQTSPELSASLSELANTHFYAGRYDVSESLNRRALEINRRLYGGQHPFVGDDLINLGAIQFQRGEFQEAERYYRQGLKIIEAWYGAEHHRTASALTMLGRALIPQERYEEGAAVLQRSLSILQRVYGQRHRLVASALNELGILALRADNLDEAESFFKQMTNIYRELFDDRHYLIGISLSNLANVQVRRNRYEEAETLLREVVERFKDNLSADHPDVGIARIKLGHVLTLQKQFGNAEQELHGGYAILRRQNHPAPIWVRQALEDLVKVYEALREPEKAAQFQSEIALLEKGDAAKPESR